MYTMRVYFILINLFFICMGFEDKSKCLFVKEKLNTLDLVGSWMTVYTQPKSINCFILYIRATTDLERDLCSVKYGNFSGQINWSKCLLEVESPIGKHYLQETSNYTGLLDNVIITETDRGKYVLHEQNADMWTLFGQRGSELLLMRDCSKGAVAIFARVSFWPVAKDIYAVLHRSGIAPLVVSKAICSPIDKSSLKTLPHYFSKKVFNG